MTNEASPMPVIQPARVWASVFFVLSVKQNFLRSCPTFDVFFIQIPLIPCQFRKTCLSATATAERRIKSLEFCFSRVGGGDAFPQAPSDFLHSPS